MTTTSNCVCETIQANSTIPEFIDETQEVEMGSKKKASNKCPHCGQVIPEKRGRGRPTVIDIPKVLELRARGLSLHNIAKRVGYSHEAVRLVLIKNNKK